MQWLERAFEIAAGCKDKSAEELTDLERTAIAMAAGCEVEFTGSGYRCKNPIGIVKNDGKFIVGEGRWSSHNTRDARST